MKREQVLVFDEIVINEGQGYDNHTGVFTAPLDGFYNFNIHVVSYSKSLFHLGLLHNGRQVIDVHKSGDVNYGSASNSVLVKLGKQDQVKLVSRYISSDVDGSWQSTTFSGHLLSVV